MPPQDGGSLEGPLVLFDELQEEILRLWKEQGKRKGPAGPSSLALQGRQTRSRELAAQKVGSLRQYINQYLLGDHAEFEAFLLRVSEMVYDISKNMLFDVHAHLKIDEESGWPILKIRTRYNISPEVTELLRVFTRDLLWDMAALRAPELPQELRICWQLHALEVAHELEFCWGDEPHHFGWLDLGRCLLDFPRCSLDMGWF
ncbi:hypothetical protein GGR51DRAFT_340963 [Nemania sp. FL0031]|nr:hypothetical protein GGR51DRAFT_340963 [Nemania sp. FL0031]